MPCFPQCLAAYPSDCGFVLCRTCCWAQCRPSAGSSASSWPSSRPLFKPLSRGPQCRPLSLQLPAAAQTWSGQCRPSRPMLTPGGWPAPLQCGGQSQAPHLQTAARRRCAWFFVTAVHSGLRHRPACSGAGCVKKLKGAVSNSAPATACWQMAVLPSWCTWQAQQGRISQWSCLHAGHHQPPKQPDPLGLAEGASSLGGPSGAH